MPSLFAGSFAVVAEMVGMLSRELLRLFAAALDPTWYQVPVRDKRS